MPKSKEKHLPTFDEVVAFLNKQTQSVSKRELARNFGIRGDDRDYLKHVLKEVEKQGLLRRQGRRFLPNAALPERLEVEVTGQDAQGDLVARPLHWTGGGSVPQVLITKDTLKPPAGVGDTLLVKAHPLHKSLYEAESLKRLTSADKQIVGVFFDGKILSVDRRFKEAFALDSSFPKTLKPNDLVLVSVAMEHSGKSVAHFVQKIGSSTDAHAASLISIFAHHLPLNFPEKVLQQADKAKVPPLGRRTDLRGVPFVTIDGADARDFDDAVYAEPDKKGWHIYVAIADVAWFVREGGALDQEAFLRGNSTYFPDRVLPMLPPALSNGVCSLNPKEDRPAMVCELWISADGQLAPNHRFYRAMIRSAARLTYEEVQADFDNERKIEGLSDLMAALKGAYHALKKARICRGVLELDMPEKQVILNAKGQVVSIQNRQRFDSHKMIEEFMILANVAAAETLEKLKMPTMYRVHDCPSPEKMQSLKTFLKEAGLGKGMPDSPLPRDFNDILSKHTTDSMLNQMILRTQAQAEYSPENIGHYGLALAKYAQFTSPIRRYADILVHRALIKGLHLGLGGLGDDEEGSFPQMAEHISATERQSAAAEQDALDRYVASFLIDRVGEVFPVRISSVTPFGLFVDIEEYGADGIVPLRTLAEYYIFNPTQETLTGRHSGHVFRRGQVVHAILKEAVPLTGGLLFHLVRDEVPKRKRPASKKKKGKTPPKNRRH